jgi:protein ImuA
MAEVPVPPANLKALRHHIQAIEGFTRTTEAVLSLGPVEIDQALPWGGLPLFCLHHVVGSGEAFGRRGFSPPATAFVATLVARLKERFKERGTVVWCLPRYQAADNLYGPALAMLGLGEKALILAKTKNETEALWTMEEALGCADVSAVVGALAAPLNLTAERRLQLAAERGRTTCFLLQPSAAVTTSTAAVTRWRVGSLPSAAPAWPGLGRPRWSLTLDRCRQGNTRSWIVEWCDETRNLRLATPLRHRSVDPVTVGGTVIPLRSVA